MSDVGNGRCLMSAQMIEARDGKDMVKGNIRGDGTGGSLGNQHCERWQYKTSVGDGDGRWHREMACRKCGSR